MGGGQDSSRRYVHKDFEEYMFKFNTSVRTTFYDSPVVGEGLDHCFDCASEVCVLAEYRKRFGSRRGAAADADVAEEEDEGFTQDILDLSQLLTAACASKRDTLVVDLAHPILGDDDELL